MGCSVRGDDMDLTTAVVTVLVAFLSGGGLVAVINAIHNTTRQKTEKEKALDNAMMYLMYFNLKSQAEKCISEGHVTTDDLKMINDAHQIYHSLGGNGFLDALMAKVNNIPISKE